jgi:hypothetical protein
MGRRFGSFDEGCLRGYNQEPLLPRRHKVKLMAPCSPTCNFTYFVSTLVNDLASTMS